MLDIRFIRENPDEVKDSIRRRGLEVNIDELIELDKQRVDLQKQSESLRAKLKIDAKPSDDQLKKLHATKQEFEKVDKEYVEALEKYQALLLQVPNLIAEDTPDGSEEANREEKVGGKKPDFKFEPKDHLALSAKHDLVDFESAARISGSKFYFLKNAAVRLNWAIQSLAAKILGDEGFSIMSVPHLVNERTTGGTGFLPRGDEDQIYKIENEDLYLIATSEIPLTGYLVDQIIDLEKPMLLGGLSTCYRKEAGSYGKFSKGLFRVHQFDKLEMYVYCRPEDSEKYLGKILAIEERICELLEIPYRVVRIATRELSAPAYKKYDIEYWSPVDKNYRELTSCSNCTDYQARRLNIRYRTKAGSLAYPHTLNGTAVTSSRTLIAVLENHQKKDGDVLLPKALYNYYGGEKL